MRVEISLAGLSGRLPYTWLIYNNALLRLQYFGLVGGNGSWLFLMQRGESYASEAVVSGHGNPTVRFGLVVGLGNRSSGLAWDRGSDTSHGLRSC